jgi:ATP-dependent Clp protease adaptor protein ClpS
MTDTSVIEKTDTKVKITRPKMWTVVFHNDDHTPMQFVVQVLTQLFGLNNDDANNIMMKIHNEGKANVGIYSKDVAETKSFEVNEVAKTYGFPLKTTIDQL